MRFIKYIFTPNHEKYDGVRPIHIYLLRLFYGLMAFLMAPEPWKAIFTHEGAWDPYRGMSVCVWAAYATLGAFGLFRPLRLLPIMVFMIFYKSLWLIVVGIPLRMSGELAGPGAEMYQAFIPVPLAMIAVPWIYFFKNYILWPRKNSTKTL